MNSTRRFTKKFIEGVLCEDNKEIFVWDSELKGLGVRILSSGRKTYFVQYRNKYNRTRRKKIGVHGVITTEQAREQAKILLGSVAKGEDPSTENKTQKKEKTVRELTMRYLELHAKPNKNEHSYIEDKRRITNVVLPRYGHKKIKELTNFELQNLHRELKDMPYKSNRLIALLSKMYNLAIHWGWAESNPTKGIVKYKEQPRTRWLNENEMQKLWEVLDKYSDHRTSFAFKLILLTGARKSEVLNATWDQFDLEKGVWTKPAHLTKQRKNEHLPLSSNAIEVLRQLQNAHPSSSLFVFPGKVEGQALQGVKRFWRTILKEAKIEDFRIHDLRHTHASHLVSSGLSLSIVGKLLGHTQAATTQRYAHLADEPLREAAEFFGNKIISLKKAVKNK